MFFSFVHLFEDAWHDGTFPNSFGMKKVDIHPKQANKVHLLRLKHLPALSSQFTYFCCQYQQSLTTKHASVGNCTASLQYFGVKCLFQGRMMFGIPCTEKIRVFSVFGSIKASCQMLIAKTEVAEARQRGLEVRTGGWVGIEGEDSWKSVKDNKRREQGGGGLTLSLRHWCNVIYCGYQQRQRSWGEGAIITLSGLEEKA